MMLRRSVLSALVLSRGAVSFAPMATTTTTRRTLHSTPRWMAAPGVIVAPPDAVRQALSDPNAVVLDVRGLDEILETGILPTDGKQWLHAPCSLSDCPLLSVAHASMLGPNQDRPILIHCASGKRAAFAKEYLEGLGYTNVLNGGGWSDLDYLQ